MTWPVLFFAAGLGTRMGTLTQDRPKPLIHVAGKPLIDHALAFADPAQFGPRVVNLHYKGQMIRDHLTGQDILFSDESHGLRETGGGLRAALPLLGAGPVITMNTDAVWSGPNPLAHLVQAWRPGMGALLLVVDQDNAHGHSGGGDFDLGSDGQLQRGTATIYTGAQIIDPAAVNWPPDDVFSMNVIWDQLAAKGRLYGLRYPGRWCDVGQPASIPLAEAMCDV